MTQHISISLLVHTRNSAATLQKLLATTDWIDDRTIIDMASIDGTRQLAETAGCTFVSIQASDTVDSVRNTYLPMAEHEWTLILDADEYLAADAEGEIMRLLREHGSDFDAFAIPRFNYIAGHAMRSSSWYPDQQIRLFRKGTVEWQAGNHRAPRVVTGTGRLQILSPPDCLHIHHDNYRTVSEFIERQVRYALTDTYEDDFDFNRYLAAAKNEIASRYAPEADGELSSALTILMSWDRIVRGVIHWERSGYQATLGNPFTLPFVVEEEWSPSRPKRVAHSQSASPDRAVLTQLCLSHPENALSLALLYKIIFGRLPDPDGMSFYLRERLSGRSMRKIASDLLNSDEYKSGNHGPEWWRIACRNAGVQETSPWRFQSAASYCYRLATSEAARARFLVERIW